MKADSENNTLCCSHSDLSITIKGDTPRLESNVMTVEFDTGGSVVSATCSVLNMNQDCE